MWVQVCLRSEQWDHGGYCSGTDADEWQDEVQTLVCVPQNSPMCMEMVDLRHRIRQLSESWLPAVLASIIAEMAYELSPESLAFLQMTRKGCRSGGSGYCNTPQSFTTVTYITFLTKVEYQYKLAEALHKIPFHLDDLGDAPHIIIKQNKIKQPDPDDEL